MIEVFAGLTPFLLVDVLNPVLFALLIFALGSQKPVINSFAILAGHTIAYFVSGIGIALGIERISYRLGHPLPVDFAISLLIGIGLLWAALASRDGNASEDRNPDKELTPGFCFGYGAVVNFIGVPFALPYFAAVDQILKANLSTESSLLVLVAYNVAYALPFALVPVAYVVVGERCKPFLEKVSDVLGNTVDKLMPVLLFLIGIALITDAGLYFSTGEPLWQIGSD